MKLLGAKKDIENAGSYVPGEYFCTKKEIQYPGTIDRNSLVTFMIGGEEKVEPFYPPETIAIVIADILRNNKQANITLCLYRSAAEIFNNAGDAYYSENEQINHIKQSLRKLDISDEMIDRILFIPSDTDSETQKILIAFSEGATTENTIAKRLEDLYRENVDFQKGVHSAILSKFRSEPLAYKYVLFELAMMVIHKPKIKAGDIREKKYDDIMRRFQKEILGEDIGENDNKQPFQTIYWNRDNSHKKYDEYQENKQKYELSQRKQKISRIRTLVAGTVLAFLATSGGAYWLGKGRGLSDAKYRTIASMNEQNDILYNAYKDEIRLLNTSGLDGRHMYSENRIISSEIAREVADSIITETRLLNLPVDTTRFSVYESMVYEIVNTYRDNRIFASRSIFEATVRESEVLKAAKKFLIAPISSPTILREKIFADNFSEGMHAWYLFEANELRRDAKNHLKYMVCADPHSGMYYSGPDASIPEKRHMLMIICESFFPRGKIFRNYDLTTVTKIQSLYRLLLPILEKNQWEDFQYYGKALEYLSNNNEIAEILTLQGLSPALLRSSSHFEDIKNVCAWEGISYRDYPNDTEKKVTNKINRFAHANWEEHKIFLKSIGAEKPEEYASRLEEMARDYVK